MNNTQIHLQNISCCFEFYYQATISQDFDSAFADIQRTLQTVLRNCENVAEHKTWSLQEAMLWINSLENGKFIKYHQILSQNFKKQKVKASDLIDMDKNDLLSFGIIEFQDRVSLVKHFQTLKDETSCVGEA